MTEVATGGGMRAHPKCVNASNPFHECSEFCFRRIADLEDNAPQNDAAQAENEGPLPTAFGRQQLGSKRRREAADEAVTAASLAKAVAPNGGSAEEADDGAQDADEVVYRQNQEDEGQEEDPPIDYEGMSERERKLFDLRLKLNQARKANQTAVIKEKKREDQPEETRGISRQKWFEEKKKRIGKQLEANGLDMKAAFMLDTQEEAEAKYKKWKKKEAAFGWDVFNQKSLYNAYKKRTKNIDVNMDEYNKAKEADPEFYRDSASLQYGKPPNDTDAGVERMVRELEERQNGRKEFSRRRKYHEEKDIDSINDRNEHFNRKIERAFGKYTVEIKNNLERGTALPD